MSNTEHVAAIVPKVSWRLVAIFVAISFGLAWLLVFPLWLSQGLSNPLAPTLQAAMMWTPAVAAFTVVIMSVPRGKRFRALGIMPLRPVWRIVIYSVIGIIASIGFVLASFVIADALGFYQADFVHLSGLHEALADTGKDNAFTPESMITAQLIAVLLGSVVNVTVTLGEELGWRGWLLPQLLPLGPTRAILISGVVWGLWHTPLILLGYNYGPDAGWLGVLAMVGSCVVLGGFLGWLRLRSNSIWPAALAHGAINAAAPLVVVFYLAGTQTNTLESTLLGWSGWIVPGLCVAALVLLGKYRKGIELTPLETRGRSR